MAPVDSPPHGERKRVFDSLLTCYRCCAAHRAGRMACTVNGQSPREFRCLSLDLGKRLSEAEQELQETARSVYEARIATGVAREQARKDLPLSTYTEAYWKTDLHNLLHFLILRMNVHAQQEIRAYATVIGEEVVAKWVPVVWNAFLDYRRHAMQLSRVEIEIIGALASKATERALDIAATHGLLSVDAKRILVPNRERVELEAKLDILGLTPPWREA